MIEPVSRERWLEAQALEALTPYSPSNRIRYDETFRYLGMSFDQQGKVICEVGCGPYPATFVCSNALPILIEPIEYPELNSDAVWYRCGIEDLTDIPTADEVWLFNCLQHVRNPELAIAICKEIAGVIRFFEPVDYPTSVCHPHTFTQSDFERWFGDCVQVYTDRVPGFFTEDCCYGSWRS